MTRGAGHKKTVPATLATKAWSFPKLSLFWVLDLAIGYHGFLPSSKEIGIKHGKGGIMDGVGHFSVGSLNTVILIY